MTGHSGARWRSAVEGRASMQSAVRRARIHLVWGVLNLRV